MAKLTIEEIIHFYKDALLSETEIQARSGYFTSTYKIKKVLEEARKTGKITPEDDLKNQEEQERKKAEIQKQKREIKQEIRQIIAEKYKSGKSVKTIIAEIKDENDIKYSSTTIYRMLNEAISVGLLTQEEYDKIAIENHKTAEKNRINASKKEEELTF